jgi:hypothetical protein
MKLPSGLIISAKGLNKADFFEILAVHFPFSKMQGDRQKKGIEADWKAYSKAQVKDKKEGAE